MMPHSPTTEQYEEGRVADELTVAIADTHAVLCESLAAYLDSEEGFRVVGATSSPVEIHGLIAASRPDVLVLGADLLGDESLMRLREITMLAKGPAVVLLMSQKDRDAATNALRLGVAGCVLKRAPLHELVDAIRSAAHGEIWISSSLLTVIFAEYRADSDMTRAREQLNQLTPRELEVLQLLVEGASRENIAAQLHLSRNTVRTHTQNLEKKLKVRSAVAAVSIALRAGLRPK
jgi:DNA-binding NarL/FixJ family response regulator